MAGTLGDLTIDLNANIAKFLSAMDMAELKSKRTGDIITKNLVNLGVGLIGGASIAAIKGFIDGVVEGAAKLKDFGEIAGTSAEQMSTFLTASKLSGTSMETVTEGLVKLAKGMAGSEDMTGNAGRALKALGIDARDAAGNLKDPAAVMKEMAAKLGDFKDGAGKTALAIDAFGKSGAQLLPMMKEMYELGDQEVKVTDAQALAADDYEKGLKRLSATKQAMMKTVVMAAIPVMNDFVQTLLEAANGNDGLRKSVKGLAQDGSIKEWAQSAALEVASVIDMFDGVARVVDIVGKFLGNVATLVVLNMKGEFAQASAAGKAFEDDVDRIMNKPMFSAKLKAKFDVSNEGWSGPVDEFGNPIVKKTLAYSNKDAKAPVKDPGQGFIDQLERQLQQQEKGRFEMLRLEAAQKSVSAAAEPYIAALEQIEIRQEKIKRDVDEVAKSEAQRAKSLQLVTAGNDQAGGIIRETAMLGMNSDARRKATELRKVDAMVEQLSSNATTEQRLELMRLAEVMKTNVADAIDADIKKQNELNASWEVGANTALEEYMKKVTNVADQTNKAMTGAFQGMEDALVNFVQTGKLDFSSLANSIIADMIRMTIQQSIMKPLTEGFKSGGLSGMLSAGASLLGFSGGGDPPVGKVSIVGESGPELFVPKTAGTIIPNSQLGGNGQTININITASVGDIASKSDVVRGMRATANNIIAQISRNQRYGGAMA